MNYAQFLYDGFPEDAGGREDAKQIMKASERGAALIRQLLAFSRKQMQRLDVLDLNEIIANLEKMLRRLMGEDIALHLKLDPALGKVKADVSQIEQVLMNLVVNARDAMPGGGTLTIETTNVDLDEEYSRRHADVRPGDYILLAVSDTGMGMSEEVRGKLFEPFFTTKEFGKGTGLGLATVYGIVKQSGGNIWVYSERGKGSTFKIYLPLVKEAGAGTDAAAQPPVLPPGTETILLVEDEPMVRKAAHRILAGAGYRVVEAGDPAEALGRVKDADGIDLLLTDVVMPSMSGRELSERLREQKPDLRVLYMSGYTENAIVHHGVLEANVLLLPKPFTRESLLQMVRKALQVPQA
jgi:CheY-like chemotaxis protein